MHRDTFAIHSHNPSGFHPDLSHGPIFEYQQRCQSVLEVHFGLCENDVTNTEISRQICPWSSLAGRTHTYHAGIKALLLQEAKPHLLQLTGPPQLLPLLVNQRLRSLNFSMSAFSNQYIKRASLSNLPELRDCH